MTVPALQQGLGLEVESNAAKSNALTARFVVPPFTVLDARQGYWQNRKNAWLDLGIKSEIGRGENLVGYAKGGEVEKKFHGTKDGKPVKKGKAKAFNMGLGASAENKWAVQDNKGSGTSVFDPVLCELCYRWFSPPDGAILDPFAGGSVRGIVAAWLGRHYVGIDLSAEQIEANNIQAEAIVPDNRPLWVNGDSYTVLEPPREEEFDFVFSCPPYADLEVYSDDPADLSNMPYDQFRTMYQGIIGRAVACLKPNRFAAFVVGDIRDKKGIYRNFVGDTIAGFEAAGAAYYNEAMLLTSVGSLPLRVGRQFEASRKLGKAHQNLLVFVKGDPKAAAEACGPVDTGAKI